MGMDETPDTAPEAEPQGRLNALDDRRRNVRIEPHERAYSAYVKRLRRVLPGVALFIVGALLVWPKIQMELNERRFAPSTMDRAALEKAATENKLINANFSSVDSKGRPFTITADQAVQETANPDNVQLENPHGTLKISDTADMTAKSVSGVYAQGKQHLTLLKDVVLTRSDGTTLNTEKLFVDMVSNSSSTDLPVIVDGPQGHLTAQGMDMKNGGEVTVFTGPAKLILQTDTKLKPAGTSDQPSNTPGDS